ncbi:hypothetical protein [Aeromicrobium chenweiae]|uniref:Uncharacterized protein n=1 Tax=Aeromicrobium chenweiae TaxID=2079793 RepID=A0A2S0WKI2_9ACTN|nr:hypothetical protein [Aeromicrobium chenweiae]AWB91859.1 hypothetical protein C3E78_06390 [Aeromicrobium chenweiae]TGN32705.1 hypothetical protein E4L97_08355 [Aeromicrobium chenweiae]
MTKLYDLFGLENGPKFRSRGWIKFQLIVFALFGSLEVALLIEALIDGSTKGVMFYGASTLMFGALFAVSVHQ